MIAANTAWRGVKRRSGDAAMTEFANRFDALPNIPTRVRASNARRHSRRHILAIALARCAAARPAPIWSFAAIPKGNCCNPSGLKLENGIPSPDTCSRLLGMLDLDAFRRWFVGFGPQFAAGGGGARAVDGKTWLRSYGRAVPGSPLHLVSAGAEEQRPVLGPPAVDAKSSAIAAQPRLLEMLTLRGKAVTANASHGPHQATPQVIEPGRRIMPWPCLKGQGRLRDDVPLLPDDPAMPLAQDIHSNQQGTQAH